MIIIEDTREQLPLKFPKSQIVMSDKLNYGDYSSHMEDGIICPVYFERKGIGDLFGTLGKGHKRFKEEINRCTLDGNKLVIIIEATLTEIYNGYKYSKMSGKSIAKILFTLMTKHHIPFVCCTSRREMAKYIYEFYTSWEKNRA